MAAATMSASTTRLAGKVRGAVDAGAVLNSFRKLVPSAHMT